MRAVFTIRLQPESGFSISQDRERWIARTLDHIPGSTLRGALATLWRQQHGEDDRFRRMFLSGQNVFPFCYPGPDPSRPAPLTARTCKRKEGLNGPAGGHGVVDLALAYATDRFPVVEECQRGDCDGRLIRYRSWLPVARGGRVVPPHREVRMHVGIDRVRGGARKGLLFGHEVVPPFSPSEAGVEPAAVSFVGRAVLDPEDAAELGTLVRHRTVSIGRSRSSGFGQFRVEISEEPADPRVPVPERAAAWSRIDERVGGTTVALTLVTPAILLDRALRYHSDLVRELRERLALNGDSTCYVDTVLISGWNLAANVPKSRDHAVAAGSVLIGRSELRRDTLVERMSDLELTGIGIRRSEGFGAVYAWDPWLLPPSEG